jgi:hypothetical protein
LAACAVCGFDPDASVVQVWEHRIESYVPSFNSIGLNSKNNHKYRWWKRQWEEGFGPWLKTIPAANKYRRVQITRLYGHKQRRFDRQNFAGGCKPLLDTLTNFGALYDDSETWCSDRYVQKKSPDGSNYVEVRIEETE